MRRAAGLVVVTMLLVTAGVAAASSVDSGASATELADRGSRVQVVEPSGVAAQQDHLNALFDGYGIAPLTVDGNPGPITRQRLCAFRLAAGLPVSTNPMAPGSAEERRLLATDELPMPFTSALLAERWVLVDRTCQIMFVGEGSDRLRFVFPTSTGSSGFATRLQDRTPVFKYNAARSNGGWHDSTLYPSAADNPLNGNMYKPLYFDRGQAIHGATNVPRYPASKGCVRLRVRDMDRLVNWLGLGGIGGITFNKSTIDLTVNVQGRWSG